MARPIRRRSKGGFISKRAIVWADVVLGRFVVNVVPDEARIGSENPDYPLEPGDNVYLEIPGFGDNYTRLDLTRLTSQELDFVETVMARAIATARPIVERRDAHAAAAEASGDDSYSRIYRQVPQLVVRARDE